MGAVPERATTYGGLPGGDNPRFKLYRYSFLRLVLLQSSSEASRDVTFSEYRANPVEKQKH